MQVYDYIFSFFKIFVSEGNMKSILRTTMQVIKIVFFKVNKPCHKCPDLISEVFIAFEDF